MISFLGFLMLAGVFWVFGRAIAETAKDKPKAVRNYVLFLVGMGALLWWWHGDVVHSFPADVRGAWRDDRGVSVMIYDNVVQWHTAQGTPTKKWECYHFRSSPGFVSFHTGPDDRFMEMRPSGFDVGEWDAIEFGTHEEDPDGNVSWLPHSAALRRMR